MMRIFLYVSLFSFIAFLPACQKTTDNTVTCNNGVQDADAGETEIDCGGPCNPCPSAGTMSATINSNSFNAQITGGTIYGANMRVYGNNNNGSIVEVLFSHPQVNQTVPVNSITMTYGDQYFLEPGDSGSVTVTSLDTLRKIVSGTFSFTATRVGGTDKAVATGGVFTNIRYKNQ